MQAKVNRRETPVLGKILAEQANRRPDQVFLRCRDGDLSFRQLDIISNRLAAGLTASGIGQHDHVAVMLYNSAEFVQLVFALAKIGAVIVPVNPELRGVLIRHILSVADVGTLILDESLLGHLAGQYEDIDRLTSLIICRQDNSATITAGLARPAICFSSLLACGDERPDVEVRHGDLQAIMFTSGTTGPSKGVMVSYAHALGCARKFLEVIDYRPGETVYCPLPLFHATALWEGVMAPLIAGGTTALVKRFSASRFWDDVRRFDAGIAMGVFSIVTILMNQRPSADDRNHPLRAFYTGKSVHSDAFFKRFGAYCVENYASTEAGIAIAAPYGRTLAGSCGRVCEDTHEVRLVDAWDREVCTGEIGELVIRPRVPFIMTQGYYNNPEATAYSCRNLWFHTGDLARRDADGNFFIVDRIKDCIRRRGENISAFEVEQIVNTHPYVLESAAIAVPAEIEEDEVKAVVVFKPGFILDPLALLEYCSRHMPAFMVPRYIEFLDALPRNTVGKIAKYKLRSRGSAGITPETWDRLQEDRKRLPNSGGTNPHNIEADINELI